MANQDVSDCFITIREAARQIGLTDPRTILSRPDLKKTIFRQNGRRYLPQSAVDRHKAKIASDHAAATTASSTPTAAEICDGISAE